jgi:hypothetical protein
MALFFISYDLRGSHDYEKLYDALNEFNAVKVLESVWCFNRININSSSLRDYFTQFIDEDDGLLVSESSSWATLRPIGTPKDLK